MIQQIVHPINDVHGNIELKYEIVDSLDLIEPITCAGKECQQCEFRIGCPDCRLSNIKNFKNYLINKLEYLNLQTVEHKYHFKNPCFNCPSNFHGSNYGDGGFSFQKIFDVGKEECNACQKNFTTERLFHHICNICNTSFKNCPLLVTHRGRIHNIKQPYQCMICHVSLSEETVLSRHIINRHKLPHKCRYCIERYTTRINLELHTLSHNGQKPLSCQYCGRKYISKHSLNKHLFEHTGGKQFKCELCGKSFAKRHMLTQHQPVHHMEKAYQCNYCPKQYKAKQSLHYHLFEHTGGNRFKCDLCNKAFASRYVLNQHKCTFMGKSYHMEKIFECEYCSKQYKTKHRLDIHLYEHTGGKQFKCDICDKTFAMQYLLNQHKYVHMERSLQCTVCSKLFKRPYDLSSHIKHAHKFFP